MRIWYTRILFSIKRSVKEYGGYLTFHEFRNHVGKLSFSSKKRKVFFLFFLPLHDLIAWLFSNLRNILLIHKCTSKNTIFSITEFVIGFFVEWKNGGDARDKRQQLFYKLTSVEEEALVFVWSLTVEALNILLKPYNIFTAL
ncbi:hypothetical protein EDC96DRAFT_539884 [Choanephora cucurbitarum]|nr:hypothetical protein EDC96DRAFT_539884 [Choanephora cucurbitarum]